MNLRAFSMTLVLAFVLLAAFATLNWATLAAPTALNFGFVEVSAPLGMVMLVFTSAISGLFIIYIVLLQAGAILETRRLMKEVKAHRELADSAEASRFTELRALLEAELAQATGTLSAYLGEIEDKLDRVLAPGHAPGIPYQAER